MKMPRVELTKWNGLSYDFYPWLAANAKMFQRSKWDDAAKTQGMLQTMPTDKQSSFVHIDDWEEFKRKLISEFGNTNVFRREALNKFSRMDQPLQTTQELANQLVPAINTLKSHLKCVATFHNQDLLYSNTLTPTLTDTIIKCIPLYIRQTFDPRLLDFTEADPQNESAINIFNFISEDLAKVARSNANHPLEQDYIPSVHSIDVKPVRFQQPNNTRKQHKPCTLCSFKGFEDDHFPLSGRCGVTKLSSAEIVGLLGKTKACPTCGFKHGVSGRCYDKFQNGNPKACSKGCLHDSIPLHQLICKHNDQSPSITVSKVGADKSIPMMDTIKIGSAILDVQYDTGCQLSIITTSALKSLPESSYSRGSSYMVNLLAYNGTSDHLPATEVELNIGGKMLKMIAVDSNLNCGAAYSFPTPAKWRKQIGKNVISHSGKVSILLGGDHHIYHPAVVEKDQQGMSLLKSELSDKHIIFGRVNPTSMTW